MPGKEFCSLDSSSGKAAIVGLLNLAKIIAELNGEFDLTLLDIDSVGQGSGINLNCYTFGADESYPYKGYEKPWPPPPECGRGETKVPDVICKLITTSSDDVNVLIGEVKSSLDMKSSRKRLFHQAWTQTLRGLINSDETWGLLFHPEGAELFQVKFQKDESQTRKLLTYSEEFKFPEITWGVNRAFHLDSLLQLLKRIVAIFLEVTSPTNV